ncbi:MAG: AsnC family transcriptional regulator [Thermoplasmatales archaeon]|nr:MAG: AsnC family transcriptional regulator [Thermoplasmatales archaeon]
MENIDLKDRKILYHLDIDSRQSFSQIGKKVGLHKDVVAYRVKRLQENGIIKGFYTETDDYLLGYIRHRFYFTYQYASPEIRKEIVDYFVKSKDTRIIHSTEGHYNLVIISDVKGISKSYSVWKIIISKFRDYFANQVFSIIFQVYMYRYSFLLDEKDEERVNRAKSTMYGRDKRVEIDDFDYHLLKLISQNARMPTTEIADSLNSTAVTITNRIKKLKELGVIRAFRVNINFPKLGYQRYKVDIILKDYNKLPEIIDYIEKNPNLDEVIYSIGYVDLELLFILKNANQLYMIMEDLSIKFPNTIKNYISFSATTTHKWSWMPE